MVEKFILRSQLQVDASVELKKALKQIALKEEKSLKEVVLLALADKYKSLAPYVASDLTKSRN